MEDDIGLCKNCGRTFIKYRSNTVYCSDSCRDKRYKVKYRYIKKRVEKKKCKNCGKEFQTNNKKKVYCSSTCYEIYMNKYYKKQEGANKICVECGNKFITSHAGKVYCSSDCYRSAKKKRQGNK